MNRIIENRISISLNKLIVVLSFFFGSNFTHSQTIFGKLSLLFNQSIKLEGFEGIKSYPISSTRIDEKGNFKLTYSKADYGVGYLISADEKAFFIILNGEDIEIIGEALSYTETIKIKKGAENQFFDKYAKEHPRREQALSAWDYLEKIYSHDSLFTIQKIPLKTIELEKKRIKEEDSRFLSSLPKGSYVSWFLPTRKLVSSVSTVAQFRPAEIPSTIGAFRTMDYTDKRLYKSGLFKDAIENHFWLLENSGKSLDSSFIEMKIYIDAMMTHLIKDEKKLNETTDYLFDLLERHSLFQASEYLALKVLNEVSCTINSDLAKQLETYRVMKKGNIAPDFTFYDNTTFPNNLPKEKIKKLSDIKSPYTAIIFGSSTCPKCKEEIPEIAKSYSKWKEQGVEVVFISLDDNQVEHSNFIANLPFISTCDFKKWHSPIVESYYVFGTPTMFLLDIKREIILRPNSVKQLDSWVDWYLIQGNKRR